MLGDEKMKLEIEKVIDARPWYQKNQLWLSQQQFVQVTRIPIKPKKEETQ